MPTAPRSTAAQRAPSGWPGAFSFYPTKVMAGGEGGMIVTDDARLADEARIYHDQGKASFLTNLHTRLGSNWRMSEPHTAIALTQLRRLDEFIAHRDQAARRYTAALPELGFTPSPSPTVPSRTGTSSSRTRPPVPTASC